MELDRSDILGQDTMPIARDANSHVAWDSNTLFSVKKLVLVLVALFLGYAVGKRLWRRFLLWRERSYKLATRRRHGIPDDDLRPFNVAYTDAVMRTREEDLKTRALSRPTIQPLPVQVAPVTQREAVPVHNMRQRPVTHTALRSTAVALPGGYNSRSTETMQAPAPRSGNDLPTSYTPIAHVEPPSVSTVNRRPERPSVYTERHDGQSDNEVKKRSRHTEQDEEHEAKKTRVEGEELIDGDEAAEFEDSAPKRGSKRALQEDPEEDSDNATETRQSRGKRARKVSTEKAPQGYLVDQNMDVDDDENMDDVVELKPISRGRKRDRDEAGSTFGGDDDNSGLENEVDGDSNLRRRRRKRRTVAKRKSEATYLRGKKREREDDEDVSDNNSDETPPSKASPSRRKRGKHSSNVQRHEIERQKSDVSMDESVTSSKRVREIGEEWESNGVRYKIGPNGQRLRQALVKKARQKFVMPKDSQHPDRDVNMQIYIECWLTEEEYQRAKAEHLLAWQDSPKRSDDADKLSLDISPQGIPFPVSIPGKSLLWSASTATTPTMSPASYSPSESQYETPLPRRRSSYRHSIATSVGLPMAHLGSSTSTLDAVKRISSTSRALSMTGSTKTPPLASSVNGTDSPATSGLSDSTNESTRTTTPAKVFSKWEKQEIEAKAILRVREANRKIEKEKEVKDREEREAKERAEKERAAATERARLEKERREKERQEKERLEKEKAERAKNEKEAAASAASGSFPSITVTAPSAGPTPASSGFFSLSANKPIETTASTGQPPVPNFFAKPAEPVKPAATEFSFGGPPAGSSDAPAMTTTTTTTAPTTAPGASATNQLPFSFAAPASEQKKDALGSTIAGSTSPLGTQPSVQSKAQPNPLFSFAKSDASSTTTAAPVSAFPSALSTGTTTGTTAGMAGATTTPKFSFNYKPSASATTATTTPVALMTAPAEKKETPASVFNVKPLTSTPSTGMTTSSTTGLRGVSAATAPKYTFGPNFGSASTTSAAKDTAAKTGFGLGGTTTATASPFAANSNTGTPSGTSASAFGINPSNTTPTFGTTGSAFGAPSAFGKTSVFGTTGNATSPFRTTTAPTDSSTPLNPFSSATTSNSTKTESKPSYGFGNTTSSTTGSSMPGNPTAFGASPSTSSTPPTTTPGVFSFKASTTTPQSSPFFNTAASTGTSVFGKAPADSNNTATTLTAPTAPNFTFSMSGSQQK